MPSNCSAIRPALDGADNFETRYLVNDFAISRSIPWVYAAASEVTGCHAHFAGRNFCLRCVYPDPAGRRAADLRNRRRAQLITSIVASLQVAEASEDLAGASIAFPAVSPPRRLDRRHPPDQPARSPSRLPLLRPARIRLARRRRRAPISLCGRNAVQIHERSRPLDLDDLRRRLETPRPGARQRVRPALLPGTLRNDRLPDGRAIIKGTQDTALARSLYGQIRGELERQTAGSGGLSQSTEDIRVRPSSISASIRSMSAVGAQRAEARKSFSCRLAFAASFQPRLRSRFAPIHSSKPSSPRRPAEPDVELLWN